MAGYNVLVTITPMVNRDAQAVHGRANQKLGDFVTETEAQRAIDTLQDVLTHAMYLTLYAGGCDTVPSITEYWVPKGVIEQSVISFRIEHA